MVQIITNSNWWGWVWLYKYKGSVDYYEDLPTSWMKVWDTYNVVNAFTKDGKDYPAWTNVAWAGTDWDPLWWSIDLSDYQKKLVEWDWIDLDQDTNEISVEDTVIDWAAKWATAVQPWDLKQSDWGQSDSSAIDYIKNKPTIWNGTLTVSRNWVQINTFSANQTSNSWVDISVPTKTSDIQNDSWYIDKTVSNLDNYTLSSNLCAVATSWKYCDLTWLPTIPTDNCQLANWCWYTTCTWTLVQDDLAPYALCDDIPTNNCQLANGCWYITWITCTDVTSALWYTPYNSTNPNGYTTCTGTLVASDLTPYAKTCDISCVWKTNKYCDLTWLPTIPWVIDALNSSCTTEALSAKQGCVLNSCVSAINWKIPSAATASNQLADKAFVNSSINALAAFYITKNAAGDQFDTYAELIWTTTYYSGWAVRVPTTNDYAIVKSDETHDGETTRYSYQTSQWEYQYTVNETPLTQCQLDALNSWITSGKVSTYDWYATSKQDVCNMVCTLTWADDSHYPSAKAVADALSCAWAWDMLKSVYDPNNKNADAFDYCNFINTPTIPTDNCQLSNGCWYITTSYHDNTKQDTLTAWENVEIASNVISTNNYYRIFESDVTVSTDDTKWVAPYNTSYGYTNIDISANAWIKWVEWAIYTFIVDTTMVVASAYRNVRVKIWTWAYIPVMSTTSALAWSSYFTKTNFRQFQYTTKYVGTGALHLFTDSNTTYSAMSVAEFKANTCTCARSTTSKCLNAILNCYKEDNFCSVATSGKYCDLTWIPSLSAVATSGKYCDLTWQPTIWNATLTIQKNWTTVNTFWANATSDVTANITVPTDTCELSNSAWFITGITSWDVTSALGYTPYNCTNPAGYTTCTGTLSSCADVISALWYTPYNCTNPAGYTTCTWTLTAETVVSGDSWVTYTIKKSTAAPSWAGSNTITLVVE